MLHLGGGALGQRSRVDLFLLSESPGSWRKTVLVLSRNSWTAIPFKSKYLKISKTDFDRLLHSCSIGSMYHCLVDLAHWTI